MNYINDFVSDMERKGKSANTVSTYQRNAELFISWLENVTKEEFNGIINEIDIRAYTKYLTDTKKQSLTTINTKLTALQQFCDYLKSEGYMPAVHIPQKKGIVEPKVEVLEKNELYKFMRYTYNTQNKLNIAVVSMLINTGIRESELCSLELDDLEISERKGIATIRNGKGSKYREVPLNNDVRKALTDYIENARPVTDSNKVFIGQRGALTRTAVYRITQKIGLASIDKSVNPHMLRHQCFTAMAKNPNIDLKTISDIAGHSSVEITTKYYINSSQEEKINAVESLNFF